MSRDLAPVASPCNSVCRMDDITGLCLGCHRTLDEIAGWSAMDEVAKRAVRDRLRSRRQLARTARDEPQASPG